jgi:hypothetical protein
MKKKERRKRYALFLRGQQIESDAYTKFIDLMSDD